MTKELITTKELSERTKIPEYTIRKKVRENELKAYKVGKSFLFDWDEVLKQIKSIYEYSTYSKRKK